MKKKFYFLLLFSIAISAKSQLVQCRPKICMIDYNYHNDNITNADMIAIQGAKPDILIDNTPGGFWGQRNGGTGCHPNRYTPLGIQVFSYIAGGYEGTRYQNDMDNINSNLARVDAIANDQATGVFLDEVSSFPTTAGKAYITAIYNRCVTKGLKLILNPGVSVFDSWLMGVCDFILTDEQYTGTRQPTSSESAYLSRILVVSENITSATDAGAISSGARANGFGYSYACSQYVQLPSWLSSYISLITQPPATPVITQNGATLQSTAPYGNLWYKTGFGQISGATSPGYLVSSNGIYYNQVTLQGCSSDTSNRINVVATGVTNPQVNLFIQVYPNPASHFLTLSSSLPATSQITVSIYDVTGRLVKQVIRNAGNSQINIEELPDGYYLVALQTKKLTVKQTLLIQ